MSEISVNVNLSLTEVTLLRRALADAGNKELVDAVWATQRIHDLDLSWRQAQERIQNNQLLRSQTQEQAKNNLKGQLVLGVWGQKSSETVTK